MTAKQQRFADEYLIDCNATQAAIRAGYARNSANEQGARLLAKASVREYIDARLAEIHSEKIADSTEVLEYLTAVMRGEHTEETLCLDGDGTQRKISIDVSAKDRIKAAELIGKRYGLFKENVDVLGAVPVVISGGEDLDD